MIAREEGRLCNMKMDSAALSKRAAKLELNESKKFVCDPEVLSTLESLLRDVHAILQPRPIDYEQRRRLVQVFNTMALETFGNNSGFPVVEAFGSFIMDLFTSSSDLDLSVNFSNDMTDFPRDKKISVLRKLANVFYAHQRRGCVTGVLPVMRARVPVLKVVDCGTGIECDISVENKDGISRSLFFSIVASIDERFRILSYLMKVWAKANDINSSKDQTMNSLSIISLVAFHLQTRNPPILPPFCALLKDGMDISSILHNATGFKDFGKRNQESVAELFLALLRKLSSVENLWQHGLCASTYEGSWIYKIWGNSRIGNMSVEDFSNQSENFARSVGKAEMQKICKCIQGSLSNLSRFARGHIKVPKLKELLFGSAILNAPNDLPVHDETLQHKTTSYHDSAAPVNPTTTKRPRNMEDTKEQHTHTETPLYDSAASVNPPTTKRPRYMEHKRELDHGTYKRPRTTKHTRDLDHARYETPNVLPNPLVPLQLQASNGLYSLGPIFVPLQSAFGPYYHLQHPVASFQSGYGSHLQQHPFTSQLLYGSGNQQLPLCPSGVYNAQHNQQNHKFMLPGSWDGRGNIWPGYLK